MCNDIVTIYNAAIFFSKDFLLDIYFFKLRLCCSNIAGPKPG
jgi:hypothetical protein